MAAAFATGSTALTSLLAYIIDTRIVSGRSASLSASSFTQPVESTGRYVISNPFFSRNTVVSRIAVCSIIVVII